MTELELDELVELAKPGLAAKRSFSESVRIPLRAIVVSRQLLFHEGAAGPLNDVAISGDCLTSLGEVLLTRN